MVGMAERLAAAKELEIEIAVDAVVVSPHGVAFVVYSAL